MEDTSSLYELASAGGHNATDMFADSVDNVERCFGKLYNNESLI